MSNDNYRPLLAMGAEGFYTAAQAGPFNEFANVDPLGNPHLSFAAFVAFIIDPAFQQGSVDENAPPAEQWLWGNFDTTPKVGRGWSITLRPSAGGQLQLMARSTNSAGTVLEAAADITGPNLPSPFGTVICASLWFQGGTDGVNDATVILGVNGALVAYDNDVVAGGYLSSPFAARLGADPVLGVAGSDSSFIEFIGCGFAPVPLTIAGIGINAEFIGSSWRGFYEAWGNSNYLLQANGYDWKHRYDALSLVQGTRATVTKSNAGAFIPLTGTPNGNMPVPATQMLDIGNQSPDPAFRVTPFTPVPLNATGATIRLLGTKNTPFYVPPAFTYTTLPPIP